MKKAILLLLLLFLIPGCNVRGGSKKIVVGASATPHAQILEQCKEYIESKGYKLEIRVFDDYVLPNLALENGELDANYFQHVPYLNDFNENNGTHIKAYYKVHFEPMGIYAGRKTVYAAGDKVVVPSDKSNYDRALELLELYGMSDATIVMVEAQNIPLTLADTDFAVINGNYALASEVTDKLLWSESTESVIANTMANVIAIKEETEKVKVLVEALQQPEIEQYIKDQFKGSVVYIGKNV